MTMGFKNGYQKESVSFMQNSFVQKSASLLSGVTAAFAGAQPADHLAPAPGGEIFETCSRVRREQAGHGKRDYL